MKQTRSLFKLTRRRFLALFAAMGSLFTWPVIGKPIISKSDPKLSNKEASFYRKQINQNARD